MKTGVIDIGSNSVRMAWLNGQPSLGCMPEERLRYSRLAENATATGRLSEAPIQRTIEAVDSLLAEAQQNDVEIRRISSTSVLREATNSADAKLQMEAALGRSITILQGCEEARYSYEGAVYGLQTAEKQTAVLDVGGGSTELCWGTHATQSESVPVGAVRLKEASNQIGPLPQALAPLSLHAPKGEAVRLIGVGGTLTTMAAIFEEMVDYQAMRIHQKTYQRLRIEALHKQLKALSLSERMEQFPMLKKGRADIMCEGLEIVLTLMQALNTEQITISTTDLLFGQLLDLYHA